MCDPLLLPHLRLASHLIPTVFLPWPHQSPRFRFNHPVFYCLLLVLLTCYDAHAHAVDGSVYYYAILERASFKPE